MYTHTRWSLPHFVCEGWEIWPISPAEQDRVSERLRALGFSHIASVMPFLRDGAPCVLIRYFDGMQWRDLFVWLEESIRDEKRSAQ